MTTKRIELWECDNCGARAINGKGRARTERGWSVAWRAFDAKGCPCAWPKVTP